ADSKPYQGDFTPRIGLDQIWRELIEAFCCVDSVFGDATIKIHTLGNPKEGKTMKKPGFGFLVLVAQTIIEGNWIQDNEATDGGGIYISGSSYSRSSITSSRITRLVSGVEFSSVRIPSR
ncbi:MAG: hypothetical protein ACUVTO_06835, partial [Candidatus Caldatribacteriaceae bacterium]